MAETDKKQQHEELLDKAWQISGWSPDRPPQTSNDVWAWEDEYGAELDEEIQRLRSSGGYNNGLRAEKLEKRLKRIPKYRECLLTWLEEGRGALQRQSAAVKPAAVKRATGLWFEGLTEAEAEYAARFYDAGVRRLRDGGAFYKSFTTGQLDLEDEKLLEGLKLEGLDEQSWPARVGQIGWPFPESADSTREFRGAVPVIEFLRGLVGKPTVDILPQRRLLIEGSCLYADESNSHRPTQVNIDDLDAYVTQYADKRFEDWDKLQLVLCYFLGLSRNSAEPSATAKSVMLLRLAENISEIERRLAALNQEITHEGVAAVEKHPIQVELSPNDLLMTLLSDFTIADAIAAGDTVVPPVDAVPYIKRQYAVLQDTPGIKHAFIGHISHTYSKTVKRGNQNCLERHLIHHRLASWLRMDCRDLSWRHSRSNIVGAKKQRDLPYLPLADYVSLALGMPTTGGFVVGRRSQHVDRFSARRHVDDLIAGLLGGATDPVLRRGQVACCTKCKRPLLNLACTGSEADGTAGEMKNGIASSCTESGRQTSEFGTVDWFVMADAALLLELNCIETQTEGQFRIAECCSNRRNLRRVWFAFTADELKSRASGDSVQLIEQSCQLQLLDRFPELFEKLELQSVGGHKDVVYTAARAFRHLFGIGSPGCPEAPRRSIGWIRADAGDFSQWPPKVTPRGKFQEKLRSHFWNAARDVLAKQPLASAALALVPDVRDRKITLEWLGLYPKDRNWKDRKSRIPDPRKLLQATGNDPSSVSSEPAALDEVVRLTSHTMQDWVIPAIECPWLRFFRVAQSWNHPWRDLDELGDWWQSLQEGERQDRLKLVAEISATAGLSIEHFADALRNWAPPDPETWLSLEEAKKDDWNQVACGLLYLSFHELRAFLWHQMETYAPPEDHNTTHQTLTKHEVQS